MPRQGATPRRAHHPAPVAQMTRQRPFVGFLSVFRHMSAGVLATFTLAPAACQGAAERPGEPVQHTRPPGIPADTVGVIVRGRIASDTVVLEPLLATDAAVSDRTGEGPHRVQGEDADGEELFEVAFVGARDAYAPEEEAAAHFSLVVTLPRKAFERLERVRVETADGRTNTREAQYSPEKLRAALDAPDALTVRRTDPQRVIVRWDAERFPAVAIRDPETSRILAMGRGGELAVASDAHRLKVVVSGGIRSVTRLVDVDG